MHSSFHLHPQSSLILCALLLVCGGCFDSSPPGDAPVEQEVSDARAAELAEAELDAEKQKSIWDGEHVTFEIEHHFGTAVRDALKNNDQESLKVLFRDGAQGEFLKSEFIGRSKGPVEEQYREVNDADIHHGDLETIVTMLFEPLQRFQSQDRSRFRVLEIARGDQPHEWRIKGLLTIVGRNKDNQRQFYESHHKIRFVIPNAKKMLEEPVVSSWSILDETFRSSSQELMQEVTDEAGLSELQLTDNWRLKPDKAEAHRYQVAVADYDRDGFLDIAVAEFDGYPKLLQSKNGKSFANVTEFSGIVERSRMVNHIATWIDYDNDGYPDLLLGDRLYHNEAGKKFTDVTQTSGLFFNRECMGCSVADYDGDGRLDIYALYQRGWDGDAPQAEKWVGEEETGKANELWRNIGAGRFERVSDPSAGGGKRHSHAAAWFFYDDDHLPDLYIANDFGSNVILRNKGRGFEDVSQASGASDFATSMGVATGDLNNDGHSEIYVANMYSKMGRRIIRQVQDSDYPPGIFPQIQGSCAGNRLYSKPDRASPFSEHSERAGVNEVGWAFGAAMADWDNDGFLDLYSTSGFMSFNRKRPDG